MSPPDDLSDRWGRAASGLQKRSMTRVGNGKSADGDTLGLL